MRLSSLPVCLLTVSLLHGGLLAAALQAGDVLPAPAPQPAPEVTIQLIPPPPPVVSAPVPEPLAEPEPVPVSKPTPQPSPKPQPKPAEPDLFAAVSTEPTPAPAPTEAVAEAAPVAAASEPQFDADYLNNPAPVYPSLSRKRGEQGVVLLRVHVLADGRADQLEVLESSGYERLDDAALRAVKRWQFVPAKLGDEAVAAWVRVPVRFDLSTAS